MPSSHPVRPRASEELGDRFAEHAYNFSPFRLHSGQCTVHVRRIPLPADVVRTEALTAASPFRCLWPALCVFRRTGLMVGGRAELTEFAS